MKLIMIYKILFNFKSMLLLYIIFMNRNIINWLNQSIKKGIKVKKTKMK